jgi:hypothetical protein
MRPHFLLCLMNLRTITFRKGDGIRVTEFNILPGMFVLLYTACTGVALTHCIRGLSVTYTFPV